MTLTTNTSLADAIQTYFQRRLMAVFRKEMKYQEFAFERKLTRANTTRFLRIEKITRAATKSEGSPSTPQALSTNYLEFTLAQWGASVQPTDIAQEDIITGDVVRTASDRIAIAMAERADYECARVLARTTFRVRQGLDPNHKAKGTASSGSTVTLVCSTLAGVHSDNDFKGGVLLVYEGTNKGIARQVDSFTGSTCAFTFAAADAFPQANDTTTKFVCYGIKGMNSTFKLDSDSIIKMLAIVRLLGMKKINGSFPVIMPGGPMADFFSDDLFKQQSINIPNNRFQDAAIGRWFQFMFYYSDQPYLEDADGAEDEDTGVRCPLPIIGAGSYSIARGGKGSGKFGVETFSVLTPDHTNHDLSYVTLSAKMRFVAGVVNAENAASWHVAYNNYL